MQRDAGRLPESASQRAFGHVHGRRQVLVVWASEDLFAHPGQDAGDEVLTAVGRIATVFEHKQDRLNLPLGKRPPKPVDTLAVLKSSKRRLAAALKITPLDYFPGFPNNPAIAAMGDVPVIVEFEAVGEDTGWGVVPNCRAAEFVDRMHYVRDSGAVGVMIRINWAGVIGWSALDSLSDLNVFALAQLAQREMRP